MSKIIMDPLWTLDCDGAEINVSIRPGWVVGHHSEESERVHKSLHEFADMLGVYLMRQDDLGNA